MPAEKRLQEGACKAGLTYQACHKLAHILIHAMPNRMASQALLQPPYVSGLVHNRPTVGFSDFHHALHMPSYPTHMPTYQRIMRKDIPRDTYQRIMRKDAPKRGAQPHGFDRAQHGAAEPAMAWAEPANRWAPCLCYSIHPVDELLHRTQLLTQDICRGQCWGACTVRATTSRALAYYAYSVPAWTCSIRVLSVWPMNVCQGMPSKATPWYRSHTAHMGVIRWATLTNMP